MPPRKTTTKPVEEKTEEKTKEKTLTNTDTKDAKKQVPDIEVFGDGDMFKLLCKVSSPSEKWMKSTKAMEIPGVGCIVQVTTQQDNQIAEAVTFVPDVEIKEQTNEDGQVVGRKLAHVTNAKAATPTHNLFHALQ